MRGGEWARADRQTGKQTDRQANRQTGKQSDCQNDSKPRKSNLGEAEEEEVAPARLERSRKNIICLMSFLLLLLLDPPLPSPLIFLLREFAWY